MKILASDLTQPLNDLLFIVCLGNGAINFFIAWMFTKAFHPAIAVPFVLFLIWSDRMRVENPTLMFTALGFMGAAGGCWWGLSQKSKESDDSTKK